MSISDRDRKILWARAGNRCSICRSELVQRSDETSATVLIGEECHIVSPRPGGPRSQATADNLDGYQNLILLCPSDHSRIDQLVDEFPEGELRQIKSRHESWVGAALSTCPGRPVILTRAQPQVLAELEDGEALLAVIANAHESSYDHDELASESEVETVADFLQATHDWAEIWDGLEPGPRVRATFQLSRLLTDLRRDGWRVLGARSRGTIGGGLGETSAWYTAYLRVVRSNSPAIVSSETWSNPTAPLRPPSGEGE
jgi:hypothetical protein